MKTIRTVRILGLTIVLMTKIRRKDTFLSQTPVLRHIDPPEPLTYNQWCQHLKVSCLAAGTLHQNSEK